MVFYFVFILCFCWTKPPWMVCQYVIFMRGLAKYCFEKTRHDRINYRNLRVVAVKGKVGYVGKESSSKMVRRSSYEARVVDVSKRSNC